MVAGLSTLAMRTGRVDGLDCSVRPFGKWRLNHSGLHPDAGATGCITGSLVPDLWITTHISNLKLKIDKNKSTDMNLMWGWMKEVKLCGNNGYYRLFSKFLPFSSVFSGHVAQLPDVCISFCWKENPNLCKGNLPCSGILL